MTLSLNLVIGFDVVRTFKGEGKDRKNLYQLLRDGALGDFDGKRLVIDGVTLEIAILSYSKDYSMELIFGRRLQEEELAVTKNGLTARQRYSDFKALTEETQQTFRKLGFDMEPAAFLYYDLGSIMYWEKPGVPMKKFFFSKEAVELLKEGLQDKLFWDPFNRPSIPNEERGAKVDKDEVKKSYEYDFVMNKMGT